MENNEKIVTPAEQEEEGIDIVAVIRSLWEGRKTIFICLGIFIVLGLVAALTMKRAYTVKTVMVPQLNSRQNSSLGSLAALAGIDMGMNTSAADLSPLVYPEIVHQLEAIRHAVHNLRIYQWREVSGASLHSKIDTHQSCQTTQ